MLNYLPNSSMTHGMGDQFRPFAIQMVTRMGFQFSSMLIALLTIMLGAGAVASELDSGLIQGILTRPIHRYQYILGKLGGLVILACAYATVLFFSILVIGALFDLSTITSLNFFQIMKGWLLYLLLPAALVCVTLFGSVFFKTVSNGILMIFIYILGNVGGMVEMIGQYLNNNSIIGTGIFISLISPFQTIYSTMERVMVPNSQLAGSAMAGASMSGSGEPASVWMFVYIALYMFGFVALAIKKFSSKDIT
ncbi:ABC transporter permease [Desulfuribacillus stibiiarsenatis]|uniref:ABC transporter permease n=2 Tax=Desulfuribacillus stibiiarsenatis TaxID=1390249 RepID=A0A1E5L323_9FIRM|nr:ABC transporter permease [Desulfuribacillus stibiiarsenatis]